jgi:hypothetical protein
MTPISADGASVTTRSTATPGGGAESRDGLSRSWRWSLSRKLDLLLTAGTPTTVSLTITDRCGDWKTFVGGGATGF